MTAKIENNSTQQREWYYSDSSRIQKGPLTRDDISELIKSGTIFKKSLCWKKGMQNWEQIQSVSDFNSIFNDYEKDILKLEDLIGKKLENGTNARTKRRKRSQQKKKKWKTIKF